MKLAPSCNPIRLDRREHTVDLLTGVDREARLCHAAVTGAANAHMHVWRRMVAEAEHDDDPLEARDPWHRDTLRRWTDSLCRVAQRRLRGLLHSRPPVRQFCASRVPIGADSQSRGGVVRAHSRGAATGAVTKPVKCRSAGTPRWCSRRRRTHSRSGRRSKPGRWGRRTRVHAERRRLTAMGRGGVAVGRG